MGTTTREKLWPVVQEYTRQVAKLLNVNYRYCHWIGTDDKGKGTFTVCDLGDTTFLTLEQMQVIIDRLPEWEQRYGSRGAVAGEVERWCEWAIEERNLIDGHPRINLEHWLMGCPREKPEPSIYDEFAVLQGEKKNIDALIEKYGGNRTLYDAKGAVQEQLDCIIPEIKRREAELFEQAKNTESYKELEETIRNHDNRT